ncbi:MAG: heavy-metal-associated domain-containing protein [Treponema sp.]|jgi:cation transport ATPase|nr:heavy-metal-associated domain-containing protein [Treponema sp.]
MEKTYKIEVDCANCADKMESASKKVDGVVNCNINFMTLKMTIEFATSANIDSVMKEVVRACKKVERDCEIYL